MLKLREIRKAQGLSVPALSRISGLHRRTIEAAEARGDCRMSTAYIFAKALGVSMDELWEPNGEEHN